VRVNADISAAPGRAFYLGCVSPALTRSKTFTQVEKFFASSGA
jgi:hypothetical protein